MDITCRYLAGLFDHRIYCSSTRPHTTSAFLSLFMPPSTCPSLHPPMPRAMSSTIRGRETRGTLPDLLVGGILFLVTALALLLCVHDVLSISAAPPGPVVPLVPVLAEATLDDLVFGLESGHFTSVDLVKAYIARIDEVNPALKPVLSLNPDALALATESDAQRRRRPKGRADLHGIPVLLKDNIATADRMDTTAGSYALAGAEVGEDSTVAARLRRAGAILLGKTNLSQWSNFRGSNSSHGWSAVGGQTLGAYHPRQDPGGSSSGSGVACTLGLAAVCLGTETDGSIVAPAEKSNLAGIKPTGRPYQPHHHVTAYCVHELTFLRASSVKSGSRPATWWFPCPSTWIPSGPWQGQSRTRHGFWLSLLGLTRKTTTLLGFHLGTRQTMSAPVTRLR